MLLKMECFKTSILCTTTPWRTRRICSVEHRVHREVGGKNFKECWLPCVNRAIGAPPIKSRGSYPFRGDGYLREVTGKLPFWHDPRRPVTCCVAGKQNMQWLLWWVKKEVKEPWQQPREAASQSPWSMVPSSYGTSYGTAQPAAHWSAAKLLMSACDSFLGIETLSENTWKGASRISSLRDMSFRFQIR